MGLDDVMGFMSSEAGFVVSLDSKRRPTLPTALLAAAHIEPGDDLIAVAVGDGAIMLRNRAAALELARANIRLGFQTTADDGVVDRLLDDRRAEVDHDDNKYEPQRGSADLDAEATAALDAQAAERGATLLASLGL